MSDGYLHLKGSLPLLSDYVASLAVNLGSYEALNQAIGRLGNETFASARQGAANLRLVCLRMNLIGAASVFAKNARPDDVCFQSFAGPLKDLIFIEKCAREAGVFERIFLKEAAAFLKLLSKSLPIYATIKPYRDKKLAHLSMAEPSPTIIRNVLDLSRNAVSMAEHLHYLFDGTPITMSNLERNAKTYTEALMRSGRPLPAD